MKTLQNAQLTDATFVDSSSSRFQNPERFLAYELNWSWHRRQEEHHIERYRRVPIRWDFSFILCQILLTDNFSSAPIGFSYVCGGVFNFRNENASFTLKRIQVCHTLMITQNEFTQKSSLGSTSTWWQRKVQQTLRLCRHHDTRNHLGNFCRLHSRNCFVHCNHRNLGHQTTKQVRKSQLKAIVIHHSGVILRSQ